ncbi:ABC transporter permease [Marinomonas primoryensis]|jgi:peptide/nickel transport system permease protein|uniref:ABC transporter permease protein DppB n=1 Tax=Marinomonas primoryensis TaxID=178399 RepID=A0A859CX43_9GAMM|nr:ABC transporter permease [Marinomonas primoryensis]QKK81114.1 ABC transporter permease protein DppB [Marinomonas primoryensis]|tara:strand:+ start:9825 stop:10805 length:981 start_codon:yes stop_codon:yes gene_type:complete
MLIFLLRRLIQACFVMIIISVISFAIQDKLGDPVQQMVGMSVSSDERNQLRNELGLNDGFVTQYWRFAKGAIHGDLGTSYYYKEPALDVILKKLPATLELAFCAILVVTLIATPCGVLAAIKPKHLLSRLLMIISSIGLSVPIFIIAILMVYIFSIELNMAPSFGRGQTTEFLGLWQSGIFTKDGLKHLLLPSLTLAIALMPIFVRLIRAEMMEVLQSEYIRFAWSKGLSARRIYFIHALKNTMLPVITVGGIQAGTLVAYTILTETIFQWPGMGFLFMDAVSRVDTPLISAYLIVVGGMFVITNTVVDLIYGLVNPTVRLASHGL